MATPKMSSQIDEDERLLRRSYYDSNFKQKSDGSVKVQNKLFWPDNRSSNELALSVDRLTENNEDFLRELAKEEETNRMGDFKGWALVIAKDALASNRSLEHHPLCENPFHAHIVLPCQTDEKNCIRFQAQELASKACPYKVEGL